MKPPTIEHGRFTLRLPHVEDVSWVFHACQDDEIQRFTVVPSPYRPDDAIAWVRDAAARCEAGTALDLVVALTESGELLGAASVDLSAAQGGEIGYWVERDSRGQGVATAAVTALERWAAAALGWREAHLRIAETNEASQAVARACGYEMVGAFEEPCKGERALRFSKSLASD